jgi:DNA-binding transcriptional LysR family regulator
LEESEVPESIPIRLKRAAIILADELEYSRAADRLRITAAELWHQVSELENQLCIHIFRPNRTKVELTEEGQFLIRVFREFVTLHDRIQEQEESNH